MVSPQKAANQQDDRLLSSPPTLRAFQSGGLSVFITRCLWHGAAAFLLMGVDVSPSGPKASRRLLTLNSGLPAEC